MRKIKLKPEVITAAKNMTKQCLCFFLLFLQFHEEMGTGSQATESEQSKVKHRREGSASLV